MSFRDFLDEYDDELYSNRPQKIGKGKKRDDITDDGRRPGDKRKRWSRPKEVEVVDSDDKNRGK